MRLKPSIVATAAVILLGAKADASTVTYTYDPLGQVSVSNSTAGAGAATYSYDSAGNRTQVANSAVSIDYYNAGGYYHTRFNNTWLTPTPAAFAVTPVGGIAPYGYDWQYVSGDNTIAAGNPTQAAQNWTRPGAATLQGTYTAVWRCQVTDAAGTVTYGPNITITIIFSTST